MDRLMTALANMGGKERMDGWQTPKPYFQPRSRRFLLLLALLLVLLVPVACMRLRPEPVFLLGHEEENPLEGSATLVCQDECRDRSLCGDIDTDKVVLAKSGGPATESHDLTFPDRVTVTIVRRQLEEVQTVRNPGPVQRVWFYEVAVPDQEPGWVAGWCIGRQVVP